MVTPAAFTLDATWSGRDAPMMAEAMFRFWSTQAMASCAIVRPSSTSGPLIVLTIQPSWVENALFRGSGDGCSRTDNAHPDLRKHKARLAPVASLRSGLRSDRRRSRPGADQVGS